MANGVPSFNGDGAECQHGNSHGNSLKRKRKEKLGCFTTEINIRTEMYIYIYIYIYIHSNILLYTMVRKQN